MMYLIPFFSFAAFVIWLLAIVMEGPLISVTGIAETSLFFLPPHIVSLLLIGVFCPERFFRRVAPPFCVLTALLTMALPLANVHHVPYLLGMMGISGAFIAISACKSLKLSPAPLVSAAGGLVAANLAAIPLMASAGASYWQFASIAGCLLVIPVFAHRRPESSQASERIGRWHYLPFILVFQIISGLMYTFIMPVYQPVAYIAGIELLFYILAVPAAFFLIRKNFDLALVCGVLLGMAAFALLQLQEVRVTINMSLFAMQAGAGFIDLAFLALLLGLGNPIKAFGLGLGVFCLGIFMGSTIASSFANLAEPIVLTGHLVLNLSIVVLYIVGRFHYHRLVPSEQSASTTGPLPDPSLKLEPVTMARLDGDAENAPRMPEHIRLLLSDREYRVLTGTLERKNFREIASELSISESTVKTYMRRIYEKMGVKGKKELLQMLSHL
jgi:DNA-binding CsgD family transcriptional regulator